jgi:hypothetical protein
MMILAVFRSRSHSLDYVERLNSYGVPATAMPTPKEAKIGCGLCVKFDARFFVRAQAIMKTGKYTTFKGFYKLEFMAGQMQILPFHFTKSS